MAIHAIDSNGLFNPTSSLLFTIFYDVVKLPSIIFVVRSLFQIEANMGRWNTRIQVEANLDEMGVAKNRLGEKEKK